MKIANSNLSGKLVMRAFSRQVKRQTSTYFLYAASDCQVEAKHLLRSLRSLGCQPQLFGSRCFRPRRLSWLQHDLDATNKVDPCDWGGAVHMHTHVEG
jgi:hypothetical protein